MLLINKGDRIPLPKDYHYINNICASLYDHLTEIFVKPAYEEMNSTALNFSENDLLKQLIVDEKLHPLDALEKADKAKEIEIVLTKHLLMSIVSDMVNFIYESISTAQKGKMSVAYALLRKPFTDQLLILEQMLIDRKDFINRFYFDGNPNEYDPSSKKADKKRIIKSAVDKVDKLICCNAELLYNIRYDKGCEYGLNGITNKALHIVTSDQNYRTPRQDLNFIFHVDGVTEKYWGHYYTALPILLTYTSTIVDYIIFGLIEDKFGTRAQKLLKRVIYLMLVFDDSSKKIYYILRQLFKTQCDICKNKIQFTKNDFRIYFYEDIFFCKKCSNPVSLKLDSLIEFEKIFGAV